MTPLRQLDPLGEQLLQELMKAPPDPLPRFLSVDNGAYAVGTHIGNRRTRNEDRTLIARIDLSTGISYCLAVVCDGVGSSKRGDEAAALACATVVSNICAHATQPLRELLTLAVRAADDTVRTRLSGAGQTTLCASLASSKRDFLIANVGDSRAYSWDPHSDLIQVTEDDTLKNEMRRLHMAPNSFVNERGLEGSLSQALGEPGRSSSDLAVRITDRSTIPPGGIFIASDGIWVNGEPAFHKVARNCPAPTDLVRRTLTSAYWMGGSDNASCIAIKDPETLPEAGPMIGKGTRVAIWLPDHKLVLYRSEESQLQSTTPTSASAKRATKGRRKKDEAARGQLELSDGGKREKLENIIVEPDQD